jgi:predicted secreted protein
MSDGQSGKNTILAGGAVGTVGNIINIGGPSQTRDSIDISTMDSADDVREFIAGMIDSGEITFTCNYDGSASGTADKLNIAFLAGTAEVWTITIPGPSIFACSGFITALGPAIPFDDKITQDVTIKLSGVVTYTDETV